MGFGVSLSHLLPGLSVAPAVGSTLLPAIPTFMFDQPRRRRRRRIIWPLLVTVVVVIALVVATGGGDTRSTIGYLEDMQNSALELSRAGSTLNGLVEDLARVDRSEFESVVTGVTEALAQAEELAEEEAPTPELVGAAGLYRLALDRWTEGIEGVSDAILRAADDPEDETAVDELALSVLLVRAGDEIYDALLDELARDEVPAPVAEMPDVRLLPVETPVTVLAPAWVSAARSGASGLPIRPSVRIEQVMTEPEWVTSADGSVVVPILSDTLDVIVVIANSGNTATSPGQLDLVFSGTEGEPIELTEDVPVIQAGASTTIIYAGLAVMPGSFYQVDLSLDPGGLDTFTEDNRFSTGFLVNQATTSTTEPESG